MRLEGKPVSDQLDELAQTMDEASLLVVMCRPSEDDLAYLRGIERKGEKVGVRVDSVQADSIKDARRYIVDRGGEYDGIMAFDHTRAGFLKKCIPVWKDVDGFHPNSPWYPCTAEAVLELLEHYGVDVEGKHVVVVNRSQTVGRPLAKMLLGMDATVTVCHSRTKHLRRHTSAADVVVTAVGKGPIFTQPEDFAPGAIVIDVGMDGDLRGDVDFEACRLENYATNKDVGRVTTSMLMLHVKENVDA